MSDPKWRDPNLEVDVDPLPEPETHPQWVQLTMDYFCKSTFYDARSLTALFRARFTPEDEIKHTIATTPGVYYTVFTEGKVPIVMETENVVSKDTKMLESHITSYYSIVRGVVTRLPNLRQVSMDNMGIVASIATSISLRAGRESLQKLRRSQSSPKKQLKRQKMHSAGAFVDGVISRIRQHEADLREQQMKRQQEEEEAATKQRLQTEAREANEGDGFTKIESEVPAIVFTDPRTSKQLQFKGTPGLLNYTVNGEPREPVGVVHWVPAKSLLKFPETKKGAKLPATGWQKILQKLRRMCDVYKIKHNLPD